MGPPPTTCTLGVTMSTCECGERGFKLQPTAESLASPALGCDSRCGTVCSLTTTVCRCKTPCSEGGRDFPGQHISWKQSQNWNPGLGPPRQGLSVLSACVLRDVGTDTAAAFHPGGAPSCRRPCVKAFQWGHRLGCSWRPCRGQEEKKARGRGSKRNSGC